MIALQKIQDAGFDLTLKGENLIVRPADKLSDKHRVFIRKHKPEIYEELTRRIQSEEKKIRAWLAYIEEADAEIVNEIIYRCRTNKDAREYFVKRYEEARTFVINDSGQTPH